jgi:macrolide transport system ATP-binding/permease protein
MSFLSYVDGIQQDLKHSIRSLFKSSGFSLVAIGSLALAIGANTIVFGVLNGLIFRPLPVRNPEQLVVLQRGSSPNFSFPGYLELRDRNISLSGLAAARIAPMGLQTRDGARRIWGYLVTGNYFEVVGVRPALGRFFTPAEDVTPGASPYAVLSYSAWQNRFAADPAIVGRPIRINTKSFTVLGVAPKGFRGSEIFYSPDVWVPMMMQTQIEGTSWLENRNTNNIWVIGRLKPGFTERQAAENLSAVATVAARERSAAARPVAVTLSKPGLVGDVLRTPVRAFAIGVMLLATLVLMAACLNLASLFVARSVDRVHEMGIKLALGAGYRRLARQLAIDVLFLTTFGGFAGLIVANTMLRVLSGWRLPLDVPIQFDVNVDRPVIAFALIASLMTGLVAAVAPVWRLRRIDPNVAIRPLSSGAIRRKWPLRDVLLAIQVACCCVLITGGIVAVRGLSSAFHTPIGMEPDGVTVTSFDLGLAGYERDAVLSFQRRALEAVSALPGVTSAGYGNSAPLYIDQSTTTVVPDIAGERGRGRGASYYSISPGYFRALGTKLIRGRDFTWRDTAGSPLVAIVNETFAKTLGSPDATGWSFRRGTAEAPVVVVGIVEDGKYETLIESPKLAVFFPMLQYSNLTTFMIARSTLPPAEVVGQLRETIKALDPDLPLFSLGSLNDILRFAFVPAWAATIALGVFGLLAIMLVIMGIYGLAAYAVSSRTREISIRVAIGARPGQILKSVLGRISFLLLIGSIVGVVLGFAASRILSSIVYQASAIDPIVIFAALVMMGLVGLAASWMPARRALALDAVRALRDE